MLIKNHSARGWHINGDFIAPLETKEIECAEADVKDNVELEILKAEKHVKFDADVILARAKLDSKLDDAAWAALSEKDQKHHLKAAVKALTTEHKE